MSIEVLKLDVYRDVYDKPSRLPDDVGLSRLYHSFDRLLGGGYCHFHIVQNELGRSRQDCPYL